MSQTLIPLDGGTYQIVRGNPAEEGIYLSPQFTAASKLLPQETEWRKEGRPIYDRLPASSQRYKQVFSYEEDSAYTYIPYGEGYTGPFSLAVKASGDGKFLTIQAGKIVWKHGTIEVNPAIIDLELVGFGSAKYLLAYQLFYDDSPRDYTYEVSDFNLLGQEMKLSSGTDSVLGWRYAPRYAFSNRTDRFWSNFDSVFPYYSQEAFLSWETQKAASFSRIVLRCPRNSNVTGTASLHYLNCIEGDSESYCTQAEWVFAMTTTVKTDNIGQFFEFIVDSPVSCRGWKVSWSDSKVSINGVYVSGVLTQVVKPASPSTRFALVAYPLNSVPNTVVNSSGKEVPAVFCKIAQVDVDSFFTATNVTDIREVVNTNYETVAEWLTRPWDEALTNLFGQFSNFPQYWMNPETSLKHEYLDLSKNGIYVLSEEL